MLGLYTNTRFGNSFYLMIQQGRKIAASFIQHKRGSLGDVATNSSFDNHRMQRCVMTSPSSLNTTIPLPVNHWVQLKTVAFNTSLQWLYWFTWWFFLQDIYIYVYAYIYTYIYTNIHVWICINVVYLHTLIRFRHWSPLILNNE